MLVTYESAYLYHHEYNVNHLSCHLCSLTIYGLHVFFLQTCFRHGHSPIYGHPWLYTWHVGILDQVQYVHICTYMVLTFFLMLWAPETNDTYESSILQASCSP